MRARVLVRRVAELKTAVIEALDFLEFEFSGKKVWVKPNLLGPYPPDAGVTTDPELVHQVVLELKRRGASRIWVADNPAGVREGSLEEYLAPTGVVAASEGCFVNAGVKSVKLTVESRFVKEVPVSNLIEETDVILNLPVFKTHALTVLTGAIKNMFGIIPGGYKSYLHTLAEDGEEFAELLVDIYQAIKLPILTIMDGLRGMDGINGPSGGRVLRLGILLASSNAVALDAVMALLVGVNPQAIPILRIAGGRHLGPIQADNIEIEGDFAPIRGFRVPDTGFASLITRVSKPVYQVFVPRVPVLDAKRCVRCGECAGNCPVQAITLNPYPEIDRRRCIRCFCCSEICPVGAMKVASRVRSLWERFRALMG